MQMSRVWIDGLCPALCQGQYSKLGIFFAVLLSPVLDGFEWLLSSHDTVLAVIKSWRHQLNPARNYWERRESNPGQLGLEASVLTVVLRRPPYLKLGFMNEDNCQSAHLRLIATLPDSIGNVHRGYFWRQNRDIRSLSSSQHVGLNILMNCFTLLFAGLAGHQLWPDRHCRHHKRLQASSVLFWVSRSGTFS